MRQIVAVLDALSAAPRPTKDCLPVDALAALVEDEASDADQEHKDCHQG